MRVLHDSRPISRFVHSRSDVCYSAAFDVTLIYYVVGFHIFYQKKWLNGMMHGRGTYTFSTGSVYSGEFKNDEFNGIGTFTQADGTVYSGEFKDDLYHGRGKLTLKDGFVLDGIFEQSKFLKAI